MTPKGDNRCVRQKSVPSSVRERPEGCPLRAFPGRKVCSNRTKGRPKGQAEPAAPYPSNFSLEWRKGQGRDVANGPRRNSAPTFTEAGLGRWSISHSRTVCRRNLIGPCDGPDPRGSTPIPPWSDERRHQQRVTAGQAFKITWVTEMLLLGPAGRSRQKYHPGKGTWRKASHPAPCGITTPGRVGGRVHGTDVGGQTASDKFRPSPGRPEAGRGPWGPSSRSTPGARSIRPA